MTDEWGRVYLVQGHREFQAWEGGHYPAWSNVPHYRDTHLEMSAGRGNIFCSPEPFKSNCGELRNIDTCASLSVSLPFYHSPFPVRGTHGRRLLSASDLFNGVSQWKED